jgi:hypothetical protein
MSAARKNESERLIEILTQSVEIMWKQYHAHLSAPREPGWEDRAWVIFQRCMSSEARLHRVKRIHERLYGHCPEFTP